MMSVEVRVRRADRPEFAPWAPKPRYVHYDPIPKSICDLHLCANYNNRENGYCFRAPSAPPTCSFSTSTSTSYIWYSLPIPVW